ncbi:MAG: PDZ domain-containing protein, partial [Gammaproteobacteria bacterium]
EYKAKVVGTDAGTDVALLKINADDLQPVDIGDSQDLKVGQWVVAVGQPFGFDHTVTAGIVSAKKRQIGREQYVPYIQTDVAINPGNSGGPLVDLDGRVVGINSQIWTRSGGYMGISFAIPIEVAMHVAEQLKKHGKVRRGYLGVTYQDVDYDLAQSFGMDEVYGAIIPEVSEGSPAERGGLKAGDIVLEINGHRLESAADLPFMIGLTEPGERIRVKILRDGKEKNLTIKVGERPDQDDATSSSGRLSNRLGLSVAPMPEEMKGTYDEEGVVVTRVEKGPALRAGIQRGDIIVSINREKVPTVKRFREVVKKLPAGKRVPVLLVRPGLGRRFVVIEMPKK